MVFIQESLVSQLLHKYVVILMESLCYLITKENQPLASCRVESYIIIYLPILSKILRKYWMRIFRYIFQLLLRFFIYCKHRLFRHNDNAYTATWRLQCRGGNSRTINIDRHNRRNHTNSRGTFCINLYNMFWSYRHELKLLTRIKRR